MIRRVRSNGGLRVWEDFAMSGIDPKCVAYVARLIASDEGAYDLAKFGKERA